MTKESSFLRGGGVVCACSASRGPDTAVGDLGPPVEAGEGGSHECLVHHRRRLSLRPPRRWVPNGPPEPQWEGFFRDEGRGWVPRPS